jgi:uncharacterized SAM-binding protein YcdF (DUF218 family)
VLPLLALGILWFFATPPVANALVRGLEVPVLTRTRDGVTYDAAVVLTGVMDGNPSIEFGESAYNESVERVLVTLDLLRSGRVKSVLVSGTSWVPAAGEGETEARRVARDLERWGIDPSRIVVEEASRNTRENAVDSAKVIASRGWKTILLVTSAAHMERARGCFRAVGLDVDTRATDFESYDAAKRRVGLMPRASSLAASTAAIHEYAGRIVYRVRGWTVP